MVAQKRLFIVVTVVIWFLALIISPYYIAKPQLNAIDQNRISYISTLHQEHISAQKLHELQKPFSQEYSRYLASVYAVFAAIWIIFPLIGIWVSIQRRKYKLKRLQ